MSYFIGWVWTRLAELVWRIRPDWRPKPEDDRDLDL